MENSLFGVVSRRFVRPALAARGSDFGRHFSSWDND